MTSSSTTTAISRFTTISVPDTTFSPISPSTAASSFSTPTPTSFYMQIINDNDIHDGDYVYIKEDSYSKDRLAFTTSTDVATTFTLTEEGYLQISGSELDAYNRFYSYNDYVGFDYEKDMYYGDGSSHPMVCNITSGQHLNCSDLTENGGMALFVSCPDVSYLEFAQAGHVRSTCSIVTINALSPGATETPTNTNATSNCTQPLNLYHVNGTGTFTNAVNWTFGTDGVLPVGLEVATTTNGNPPNQRQFVTTNVLVADGFLELLVPGGQTTSPYQCAQVQTVENTILYASVRTTAILAAEPGVVNGKDLLFIYPIINRLPPELSTHVTIYVELPC